MIMWNIARNFLISSGKNNPVVTCATDLSAQVTASGATAFSQAEAAELPQRGRSASKAAFTERTVLQSPSPGAQRHRFLDNRSPENINIGDDLTSHPLISRQKLANIIVEVPNASILDSRLKNATHDIDTLNKILPELLLYAGKRICLGKLLTSISRTFADAFREQHHAAAAMHLHGQHNVSLRIASCFIDKSPHLIAADRLLKDSKPFSANAFYTVAELLKRTQNTDASIREQAYSDIKDMGPCLPDTIPALIEGQGDENAVCALNCQTALEAYGLEALPHLTGALSDKNSHVRSRSILVLRELGRAATPSTEALLQALKNENNVCIQNCLIEAIANIGGESVSCVPGGLDIVWHYFEKAHTEKNCLDTTARCLNIIGASGARGQRLTPNLLNFLAQPDPNHNNRQPYAYDTTGTTSEVCRALTDLWSDAAWQRPTHLISLFPDDEQQASFNFQIAKFSEGEKAYTKMYTPEGSWTVSG